MGFLPHHKTFLFQRLNYFTIKLVINSVYLKVDNDSVNFALNSVYGKNELPHTFPNTDLRHTAWGFSLLSYRVGGKVKDPMLKA